MKTKHLFLVLVLFVAFGCKTSKETIKQKAELKTELNAKVETEAESKATTETKTVATVSTSSATNVNTKVTETEFSTPDSNGIQHVTKQTVTEQSTNNKTVADSKKETASTSSATNATKNTDNSDYTSDVIAKADSQTETQTETPWFVTAIALMVALIGMGLVFYLMKRFGVIQ